MGHTTNTKMDHPTVTNNYRTLIYDEESDFDKECKIIKSNTRINQKELTCANNTNYQDVEINRSVDNNPEEFIPVKYLRKPDDNNPIRPETVPGNSSYSNLTKSGNKICILSDSICKGINMRELNYYINKGYAYRKTFEGAKSHELAHYCVLTLLNDKPDIVLVPMTLTI